MPTYHFGCRAGLCPPAHCSALLPSEAPQIAEGAPHGTRASVSDLLHARVGLTPLLARAYCRMLMSWVWQPTLKNSEEPGALTVSHVTLQR